jgi:hypothetical protein
MQHPKQRKQREGGGFCQYGSLPDKISPDFTSFGTCFLPFHKSKIREKLWWQPESGFMNL